MTEFQMTQKMPAYRCHKEVHALKIASVSGPSSNDAGAILSFEDPRWAPKMVDKHWFNKHQPKAGGYFVQYADGYLSFSPADAFEDGYTPLDDAPAEFDSPLQAIREGLQYAPIARSRRRN